jgi:hypothetical protein
MSCLCWLPSCDVNTEKNNRQQDLKNVQWLSDDNDYGIDLEFLVLQENSYHYGAISYNDVDYEIELSWADSEFSIKKVTTYGKLVDDTYISGDYIIFEDTIVVLDIKDDSMYDGELAGKNVTVEAYDVSSSNYDATVRHDICWETSDRKVQLYTFSNMRKFCTGTYYSDNSKKDVVFYFLSRSTFIIYELESGVQNKNVFAKGTYWSQGTSMILNSTLTDTADTTTLYLTSRCINYWEVPATVWYPQ